MNNLFKSLFTLLILLLTVSQSYGYEFNINEFKIISVRYARLNYIKTDVSIVKETFAVKNGIKYRVLNLMLSTETSSVGHEGAVIEVSEWNGAYYPAKVIYQVKPHDIYILKGGDKQ